MDTNFNYYNNLSQYIKDYRFDWSKIFYICLVVIGFGFTSNSRLSAQPTNHIRVTTTVLPPYSPYLSDYLEFKDKLIVVLNNTSGSTKNVKLGARLTSDVGFIAETDPDFQPGSPYIVQPSVPYDLLANGDGYEFFTAQNINISYGDLTLDDLLADGILPEGRYTLCITAYDYDNGAQLSVPTAGSGCTSFVIDYKNAPRLIAPLCGDSTKVTKWTPQNISFMWTRVVAGIALSDVVYDLYIVPLLEGTDPQDEVMSAVTGNNINAITVRDLTQANYSLGIADIILEEGQYAWAVKARDVLGNYPIENDGLSQICTFNYRGIGNIVPQSDTSAVVVPNINPIVPNDADCSCLAQLLGGGTNYEGSLTNKQVKIGEFTIESINASLNPNGSYQGTGMIQMPVLNVAGMVKLKVAFNEIYVKSADDKLFVANGTVGGIKKPGASLMPSANNPQVGIPTISPSEAQDIVDRTKNQMISSIESTAKSVGFELPLGLDRLGPIGTISITDITFTERQASFNAAVIVSIPEINTPLALGAKNICFSKDKAICGEGTFYLGSDFDVASSGLKLLATKGFGSAVDSGTYVTFKEDGKKFMRLRVDYKLPSSIRKASDNGDVVVRMGGAGSHWNDWFAEGSVDDFKLSSGGDFVFKMTNDQKMVYDHSDEHKANGPIFTQAYSNEDVAQPESIAINEVGWRGIYIPSIGVQLPGILNNNGQPMAIVAKDLLITQGSGGGLSGKIVAGKAANGNPVLAIGDGNLAGWYYSIDNINVNIWKSSFKSSGMDGKVVLPISGGSAEVINSPASQLGYTCTLSFPAGQQAQFQFIIQPKDNLVVPIWAANFVLDKTSNIIVESTNANGNNFFAKATLHGRMSINTGSSLKPLPNIAFELMSFEGLVVQTKPDYIKCDKFRMGLASPQKMIGASDADGSKSVGGFPITMATPTFEILGNKAGFSFDVHIKLADISSIPTAEFGFGIYAQLNMDGNRPNWSLAAPVLKDIGLQGNIGPIAIDGKVSFKNDEKYGDAVLGSIKASIIGTVMIDVNAVFGAKEDYKYFYIDALAVIPAGIQLPPCLAIYGLGGGFYYNMAPPPPVKAEDLLTKGSPNVVRTVHDYTPQKGVTGFKIMVVMGLSSKEVLHFKGTYEMNFETTIDENGDSNIAVREFGITGEIFILTTGMLDISATTLYGALRVTYVFPLKTFTFNATVSAKIASIVTVNGKLDMLVSPDEWYVFVGTSANPIQAKIKILEIVGVTIHAYFMTGNTGITFPEPPMQVLAAFPDLKASRENQKILQEQSNSGNKTSAGMAFGAGFQLDAGGCFGPICLNINSGVGFDIALTKKDECIVVGPNGRENYGVPGFNGWYAEGQLYGYLQFGLEIDCGLFSATVAKMNAAALLRMSGPNPIFINGRLNYNMNILGLVKSSGGVNVKFGQPCQFANDSWPFGDLPIIQDITPVGKEVSILRQPIITYNLPVDKEIEFFQKSDDGYGNNNSYMRYFNIKQTVTINEGANKVSKDRHGRTFESKVKTYEKPKTDIMLNMRDNNQTCVISKTKSFEPLTNYQIKVTVNAYEREGGNWRPAFVYKAGPDGKKSKVNVVQEKIGLFRTKDCPTRLDEGGESAVMYAYPQPGQNYFLPQDQSSGYIVLKEYIGCLIDKYDVIFRFEDLDGSTRLDVPAGTGDFFLSYGGQKQLKYTFPIPPDLKRENRFYIKQMAKPKASSAPNSVTNIQDVTLTQISTDGIGSRSFEFKSAKVSGNAYDAIDAVELYKARFNTSKYGTMAEKINSYSVTASEVSTPGGTYALTFKGGENFDQYEVKGSNFNFIEQSYIIKPKVYFRDLHDNAWYRDHGDAIYSHYFNIRNGTSDSFQPHLRQKYDIHNIRTIEQMATIGDIRAQGPIYIKNYDPPLIDFNLGSINLGTAGSTIKYIKK